MRSVFLIAWREYKQYVLSRGFLIFLISFPLLIGLGGAAMTFLETSRPVRHFIVFDEAGGYAEAIDREIETRYQASILAAWDAYVPLAIDGTKFAPDALRSPFAPAAATRARQEAFFAAGGVEAARSAIGDYLKTGAPAFVGPRRQFERMDLTGVVGDAATIESAAQTLRPFLLGERDYPGTSHGLFAAVFIPKGYTGGENGAEAQYWSANLTDPALEITVSRALSSAARRKLSESFGLAPGQLEALADVDAPVKAFRPDKDENGGALNEVDRLRSAFVPAAMTYMLLVVIFGVGNLLLTNTIEERSNKIVEILLSSVTANELMLGKLVGIAAVGLTMPSVFALGALALTLSGGGDGMMRELVGVLLDSWFLPIYLFYFLCAYAIFAMIFLAIGAVSNSLQDAQSYMGPVMLIVFAPMPFMVLVFQNPNGLIASILTWIPIYTPYAVMMRIAADPPIGEIVGATCLMLAFAIILGRFMGRIFRAAILQSAPAKAKDLIKLARSGG
ncbi:MAG: ABC transporter permease [Parvularculaceae bacterium]|nr:ABC transporter permease [Parvularculaceae bacterium]